MVEKHGITVFNEYYIILSVNKSKVIKNNNFMSRSPLSQSTKNINTERK